LTKEQIDPVIYQEALKTVGFTDVEMKNVETKGGKFQAIYAYKP